MVYLCSLSEKTGSHRKVFILPTLYKCLLHYEHDEEEICPSQDGDLVSQATKTLTVWELLLSPNCSTTAEATVLRHLR